MFSDFEIYIDYLTKSKLFDGISPEKIEDFLSTVNYKIIEFKTGEVIPTNIFDCFFVLKGSVMVFNICDNGTQVFLTTFEADNNCVGAPGVIYEHLSCDLKIISKNNSIIMFVDSKAFIEPVYSEILTQNLVLHNLVKCLFDMTECAVEKAVMSTRSYAFERVKEYIKFLYVKQKNDNIEIPLKRSEMAGHLNMDI